MLYTSQKGLLITLHRKVLFQIIFPQIFKKNSFLNYTKSSVVVVVVIVKIYGAFTSGKHISNDFPCIISFIMCQALF